jgi:hypothetical protein
MDVRDLISVIAGIARMVFENFSVTLVILVGFAIASIPFIGWVGWLGVSCFFLSLAATIAGIAGWHEYELRQIHTEYVEKEDLLEFPEQDPWED